MAKSEAIEVEGVVLEKLPNAMFKVEIEGYQKEELFGETNKLFGKINKFRKSLEIFRI